MVAIHIVASAYPGQFPLKDEDYCAQLWKRITRAFPKCWGAVFMPDHLHLLLPGSEGKNAVFKLGVCLRATSQYLGTGDTWAPSPPPEEIPNRKHLLRQLKYVHLNPCRDGLVSDPSLWKWSTHRDIVGAAFPNWLDLKSLAKTLEISDSNAVHFLQRYITSDFSVTPHGLPLPTPRDLNTTHLSEIYRAINDAIRPQVPRRKSGINLVFASLCLGGKDSQVPHRGVVQVTRLTRQSIHRILRLKKVPNPALIKAARVCATLNAVMDARGRGVTLSHTETRPI